jgi:flagellar hook assembly protein FlgD
VRSIRAELNRIHAGYQVTFDTMGSIGNYPIEAATARGGADAIFIMGYDYRTAGSSPVGSVAPVAKAGYDIVDTVRAFAARVSPSKLILGVPYYGRAWSTSGNGLHAANISGTKFGTSTTVTYDVAADYLAKHGRRYDRVEGVAWTAYRRENCTATYGCVTPWRELYVDDATALGQKYDLVNAYRLRGAGIWALGFDGTRPELYGAIQRKFITDTTPPIAGVAVLPARQTNPEFAVAWTGTDDVGVVSYDVQRSVDGGPWTAWINATTATRASFDGDDGHAYAFRVRARDHRGNTSAWNVASPAAVAAPLGPGSFATVRGAGLNVRAAADASATKVGTLSGGDVVAIVGGPRVADGSTWYQISGPLREWGFLDARFVRRWVAGSTGSTKSLAPAKPPNATAVRSMLGGLAFGGAGGGSVGAGAAAVGARSFSPNGDGSRDGLAIAWTNGVALETLKMNVFRADGTLVGTMALPARSAGPHAFAWNGRVGATRLADGRYLVSLVGTAGPSRWFNPILGWRPSALPAYGLTIDTVAPKVSSASISGGLISPNGDGHLDAVRATIAGSGASRWAFGVAPVSGSTVGKPIVVRSGGGASVGLTWNGTGADGHVAADGQYRLQLVLLDAAGNHVARTWTVRVDRTAAGLRLAGPASFSPNGDGAADGAALSWTATERVTGNLRVYRGTALVRSWAIANAVGGAITWNGTTASGGPVRDGAYSVRVAGRDAAGNLSVATTRVVVDRTLSSLRWSPSSLLPGDGDGLAARSAISVKLARPAIVTGGIYAGTKLVRTFWSKTALGAGARSWTWDGRNAAGAFVGPGTYEARVTATTSLGTTTLTRAVLVDAFDVRLSATTVRAGQTLIVTFRTIEPLKATPTVTFVQPGRTAVRKTATSLGAGRYRVSFTVASGAAGAAAVTIAGRDTGGGMNTTTRRLTIR